MNNVNFEFYRKRCLPLGLVFSLTGLVFMLPSYYAATRLVSYVSLVGYYFFLIAGSVLIVPLIMTVARELLGFTSEEDRDFKYLWSPLLIGICETILYPTAFFVQQQNFVALWLVIKFASRWNYWQVQKESAARNRLNMYLFGNAVMLIYSYVGYVLLENLSLKF